MSFRVNCTACESPHREAIDKAVVGGVALRDIAKTYSLTKSAVHRHQKHVGKAIVKAAARAEVKYEATLLQDAQDLRARTLRLLDEAERSQDGRLQAVLIGQVRANIELLSKLTESEKPKMSDADAERWVQWWAEEIGCTPEEYIAECERIVKMRNDFLNGIVLPHTPKGPIPGGREYYLDEQRKEAERIAARKAADAQAPAVSSPSLPPTLVPGIAPPLPPSPAELAAAEAERQRAALDELVAPEAEPTGSVAEPVADPPRPPFPIPPEKPPTIVTYDYRERPGPGGRILTDAEKRAGISIPNYWRGGSGRFF